MEKNQDSKTRSLLSERDSALDAKIRPHLLSEFIGHPSLHAKLSLFLQAAKEREEALGHTLFYGPPGLGKTTLAHIIAEEMGATLTATSGPAIDKPGDLAGLLTNLSEGDVLFIDEIHRLPKSVEEYLYPAIEDFMLDIMLDSGPHARSVKVKLNPFCLVGATTRTALISSPLRSRFHFTCHLDYYDNKALQKIIERSAKILTISIEEEAAFLIGERSRGTPRIANNLLRWVRDYAQVHKEPIITQKVAKKALTMLSIDDKGLDEMDIRVLKLLIEHHDGGPVGLSTLAAALGEEPSTLAEVYEPYLIMRGFIKRTPKGREATQKAFKHFNPSLK